jgi:fructose-1,6-bisphosphatase II
MLDASSVFYMDKIVTGPPASASSTSAFPSARTSALAKALGKPVDEIVVSVLNRPRHAAHRGDPRGRRRNAPDERRRRRRRHQRGTAQRPHRHVHRHRRQPEGVATTCAIKALGGHIQGVCGRATTTRSSAASMPV